MCLKWDFSGIEGNYATICKQLQIRIISENIFSLILIVYRHRKLGYPYGVLLAYGQARNGLIPHLKQHGVCPDSSVHTKGKMADCTCMVKPAITLLYFHIYTPTIK